MTKEFIEFPSVFVISLANSDRRKQIKKRLDLLKIPFEFVDAVYGKDLKKEELAQIDYDYSPNKFGRNVLTLGEIGCAMSHIRCYQLMLERELDQVIILEDDANFPYELKKILDDVLSKIPKRREIIFFDHGKAKSWLYKRTLYKGYKLVRYRCPSKNSKRGIFKTTGYLITNLGAKKLLKYAFPIRMPADYLTGLPQLTGIKAYGVEPPCIFGSLESEIDSIEMRK